MGTNLTVRDFNSHVWGEVAKKCRRAAVFIDKPTSEWYLFFLFFKDHPYSNFICSLHWAGGLPRLDATNTIAVRELNAFESAPATCKKAVFLISSPVAGQVRSRIDYILFFFKNKCILFKNKH